LRGAKRLRLLVAMADEGSKPGGKKRQLKKGRLYLKDS
jgi:hypothetical protein